VALSVTAMIYLGNAHIDACYEVAKGTMPQMTSVLTDSTLTTADGLRLASRAWMPADVKAVMANAVVHGIAEHGGRYAWLAALANAQGIGVVTLDLRGHGQLTGRTLLRRALRRLPARCRCLVGAGAGTRGGPALFLMGHSMGGAIACAGRRNGGCRWPG
jgi:alpha-beta hydrolase superfamily lysophospholipase